MMDPSQCSLVVLAPGQWCFMVGPFSLVCVQLGSCAWPLLLEQHVTFGSSTEGCDLGGRRDSYIPLAHKGSFHMES